MIVAWSLISLALARSPGADRQLAEHTFGLPVAVDPAFLTPLLTFRQGVGVQSVPDYRYPGIPNPLPLRLGGLTETLKVQLGINRSLSAYAQASGAVHTGLDAGSAFFLGAQGSYELRAGLRGLLLRRGRTQLAGRVGVRQALGVSVVPANLVVSLIDDPQVSLPDLLGGQWSTHLLAAERATQGVVGLSAAFAASRIVGLQASTSARLGASVLQVGDVEVAGPTTQLGAGLSVDLRPGGGLVGVQLGLRDRLERDLGSEDLLPERNRLLLTSQLYYDRTDLMLGLVVSGASRSGAGHHEWSVDVEGRAVAFF